MSLRTPWNCGAHFPGPLNLVPLNLLMWVPISHKHGLNGIKWFILLSLLPTLLFPGSLKPCPRLCQGADGHHRQPLALTNICKQGQELWHWWHLSSWAEAVTFLGVKQCLSRHYQWIYTFHLLNAGAVKFHLSFCAALPSQINFINSSFYEHYKAPIHIWALLKKG